MKDLPSPCYPLSFYFETQLWDQLVIKPVGHMHACGFLKELILCVYSELRWLVCELETWEHLKESTEWLWTFIKLESLSESTSAHLICFCFQWNSPREELEEVPVQTAAWIFLKPDYRSDLLDLTCFSLFPPELLRDAEIFLELNLPRREVAFSYWMKSKQVAETTWLDHI